MKPPSFSLFCRHTEDHPECMYVPSCNSVFPNKISKFQRFVSMFWLWHTLLLELCSGQSPYGGPKCSASPFPFRPWSCHWLAHCVLDLPGKVLHNSICMCGPPTWHTLPQILKWVTSSTPLSLCLQSPTQLFKNHRLNLLPLRHSWSPWPCSVLLQNLLPSTFIILNCLLSVSCARM